MGSSPSRPRVAAGPLELLFSRLLNVRLQARLADGDVISALPAQPGPRGLGRPPVVIAGGGWEALRALGGARVDITMVAPELKFLNRSMSVDEPFKPAIGGRLGSGSCEGGGEGQPRAFR